jgi:hypothetical protein
MKASSLKHPWKYSVILHSNVSPMDVEFMETYSGKITHENGTSHLHFFCSEVNAENHLYLEMTCFLPNKKELMKIRIPHGLVLMIFDPTTHKNPFGFISPEKAVEPRHVKMTR